MNIICHQFKEFAAANSPSYHLANTAKQNRTALQVRGSGLMRISREPSAVLWGNFARRLAGRMKEANLFCDHLQLSDIG
jgi:hypothetical protein